MSEQHTPGPWLDKLEEFVKSQRNLSDSINISGAIPNQIVKYIRETAAERDLLKTQLDETHRSMNSLVSTCADVLTELLAERDRLRALSLEAYLARSIAFSPRAFGPGKRTEGICKHIVKELNEIRQAPDDLEEWIDVMILSADGFWRAGGKPEQLAPMLFAKLAKNEARRWPQTTSEDAPVEHVREPEAAEQ